MPWHRKAEAEALLDRLAALIATQGPERLLAATICEPTPRHFPDTWEPTPLGVGRLVHRLFHRVGLAPYPWLLEDARPPFYDEAPDLSTTEPSINFLGQQEGTLIFELGAIGPPDRLVGALCFEIARAYLEAQRLVDPYRGAPGDALDPHSKEARVQAAVATIYLGFGPLAIEASHSYRASGEIVGNMAVSRWSHAFVGALPTADLTFLFAVQLVLRGEDEQAIARLLRSLNTEQAQDVRAWIDELTPARDALATRLRLPLPLELPNTLPLADAPPLDAAVEEQLRSVEERHRKPLANVTVHRSYERKTVSDAMIGAILGMIVGVPLGIWASEQLAFALLSLAVGGIGGALYSRRHHQYSCSACAMILLPSEPSCPQCGARFEGEKLLATRPHQLEDDEDEQDEELAQQALASRGGDKRGLLDEEDNS